MLIMNSCTSARAQSRSVTDSLSTAKDSHPISLRTNLIHDLILVPNLGVDYNIRDSWSVIAGCSFNWLKNDKRHRYWRILIGEVELRKWLSSQESINKGHHLGVYGALYRYDLEWGGRGWQADINYGGGICYGYSFRLNERLALDLSAGLGYIGGTYKKYDPEEEGYVWKADVHRHYFGPTKLEATLVWNISSKKGGLL